MDSVTQGMKNTVIDMTHVPDDLVFGLDIGTRSVVGTVGYKNNTNGFVAVAQAVMEHETRAMLDGQIHDIGQVARTIEQISKRLEEMTGRKYKDVCIAAAGRVLETVEATAEMRFSAESVVTRDQIYSLNMLGVEHAYETLRQELMSDDEKFYCVGYSVKQYYQNDYPISNLEGHKCTRIRTDLIATFLPDEVVDGLYAAVERAGLYVANLTLEPIAAINVAIPEQFRLLNIALVDVGAGTSDISITRDGSIIAYGMIPAAGDEITETIAKHYLTDFTEADRMKCASTSQDEVAYHDIMGLPQKVSSEELISVVDETVRMITKSVSDRIIELNGGKPVSAIFVVGGGGKVGGFVESLAEYQGLQQERVALRGEEVLGKVRFLQEDITVDSLLVTPIGICLNYYEQKNNFIFVTVNGERIKLYDNNKLTIMDAAMQIGFPNEELFPQRGESLTYFVDGERRMLRGEAGEAAVIHINGKEVGINTPIALNDKIEIISSTKGAAAELTIGELSEYKSTICFEFNGKSITAARFVSVNGELVSEFYSIHDQDDIKILDYYTLKQVLEFMDIIYYDNVYVNNIPAQMDTKVYDNFTIRCDVEEQIPSSYVAETFVSEGLAEQEEVEANSGVEKENREKAEPASMADGYGTESDVASMTDGYGTDSTLSGYGEEPDSIAEEYIEGAELDSTAEEENKGTEPDSMAEEENEGIEPDFMAEEESEGAELDSMAEEIESFSITGEKQMEAAVKQESGGVKNISIMVNGEPVVLRNKTDYIFVDILDFYPFDTSVAHGDHLELRVNGIKCDFTHPLKEGDQAQMEWVG